MTTMFIHQRPIVDKQQFYQANGSGRDSYINFFSGGYIKDKVLHVDGVYEKGTITGKLPRTASLPRISAKYAHYLSDGTGRDQYILVNEGGMTNQPNMLVAKPPNYLKSLRQYPKIQPPLLGNDFLRLSMLQLPIKAKRKQQIEYMQQLQNLNIYTKAIKDIELKAMQPQNYQLKVQKTEQIYVPIISSKDSVTRQAQFNKP